MKSICALLDGFIEDFKNPELDAPDTISRAVSRTWDGTINFAKSIPSRSLDTMGDIASGTVNLAGHTASGVGKGLAYLGNTAPVRNTLIAGAGLATARLIGKKMQDREEQKASQSNFQPTKPPKYKAPPKFESVDELSEQNENLPRFPQLSYINKIPKSPRSVASFFMRRKPSTYSVNAGDQSVEAHRKNSSRFVKRSAADTGVDRVVGKLVA